MTSLTTITQDIIQQIPPNTMFSSKDGEFIIKNQALLLSISEDLIRNFYETLYAHPSAVAIFIMVKDLIGKKLCASGGEEQLQAHLI